MEAITITLAKNGVSLAFLILSVVALFLSGITLGRQLEKRSVLSVLERLSAEQERMRDHHLSMRYGSGSSRKDDSGDDKENSKSMSLTELLMMLEKARAEANAEKKEGDS